MSLEDEWRQRNEATNAVIAYCRVEEGGPRRGRKPRLDRHVGQMTREKVDGEA